MCSGVGASETRDNLAFAGAGLVDVVEVVAEEEVEGASSVAETDSEEV
jgi:hypothetical protein